MNIQDFKKVYQDPNGWVGHWIVGGLCIHCKCPIGQELCWAVSYPHMGLLHRDCMQTYHFHNFWPHPVSFQYLLSHNQHNRPPEPQ